MTKQYTVTVSVTVELEDSYAPTLEEAKLYLSQRVGNFLYPAGMKVLSVDLPHPAPLKVKHVTCKCDNWWKWQR